MLGYLLEIWQFMKTTHPIMAAAIQALNMKIIKIISLHFAYTNQPHANSAQIVRTGTI